jgi:hypothetical protein
VAADRRALERAARRGAKAEAEAEATRPADAVPKATPVESFTTVTVEVPEELVYPAGEDRELVVAPGEVEMSFRMRPVLEGKARREYSVMGFEWRLADAEGAVWQTMLWWLGEMLHDPWHRPSEVARTYEFVLWSEAPEAWQEAMESNCLLADEVELIDSREVVRPVIGGIEREIFTKYQGGIADAAYVASSNRIVVRIKGLFHDFTEVGWDGPDRDELEPFGFEMRCEEFLPSHVPQWYFAAWEEWPEVWEGTAERRPVVFEQLPERGTPQPLVTTRPAS